LYDVPRGDAVAEPQARLLVVALVEAAVVVAAALDAAGALVVGVGVVIGGAGVVAFVTTGVGMGATDVPPSFVHEGGPMRSTQNAIPTTATTPPTPTNIFRAALTRVILPHRARSA